MLLRILLPVLHICVFVRAAVGLRELATEPVQSSNPVIFHPRRHTNLGVLLLLLPLLCRQLIWVACSVLQVWFVCMELPLLAEWVPALLPGILVPIRSCCGAPCHCCSLLWQMGLCRQWLCDPFMLQ
jgi:hypothetical protein